MFISQRSLFAVIFTAMALAPASFLLAQNQPYKRTTLPQTHDYQQVIYKFMASVTEKDVTHGVTGGITVTPADHNPEYLYRNHIYGMMLQPLIGSKRGAPAVTAAPICFTLPYIEVKEELRTVVKHPKKEIVITIPPGVYRTWAWPEVLASFLRWEYPGNPYYNNRALKLRDFMVAATDLMMFHDLAERNPTLNPPILRPDWHGYSPVFWAFPYPAFKDVLPPEVQEAYETGLKATGELILAWGIRGETCEGDYITPVGLLSIARAINDPEFSRKVEEYARPLYTDPRYFHPAGYWDERGGIETGFGGLANWFAAWTALMSDWPCTQEALERVYRLRRHLILPEPDGTWTGPSHFNSRLGSPPHGDQWAWNGVRDATAAQVTDEAAQFVEAITDEQLSNAPAVRAHHFNSGLGENIRIDGYYLTNADMLSYKAPPQTPWGPRRWMTYNFPASVNPGYEHYRKGAYAHRRELEKANSPLLKSPFLDGATFTRAFEKDFAVTRQPGYAAILHSGPVGTQRPDDNMAQFAGPMGLGGGQLSAFWTPQAGAVILSLRSGMSYDKSFDVLEDWRTWPQHAVSGVTADGTVCTSARNATPAAEVDVKDAGATVKVGGPLVTMTLVKDPAAPDPAKARSALYDGALAGDVTYARTFTTGSKDVTVVTTVRGDGKVTFAELYETIPIFLGKGDTQRKAANVTIELQTGGAWAPATEQYVEKVRAIRVTRFGSPVVITLDSPRRVKLSPAEWTDDWLNKGATCRNLMIDLLENGDKPAALTAATTIRYTLAPAP